MQLFHAQSGFNAVHHSIDPHPTRQSFHMHVHRFYEIYRFLSGEGFYSIEGRDYRLRPGCILLMRDGETHMPHINESKPYERIAIHFDPDAFLPENGPYAPLRALFSDHAPGCDNFYLPTPKNEGFFSEIFSRICRPVANEGEFLLRLAANLPPLLCELLAMGTKASHALTPPDQDRAALAEIIDYVNAHLTEITGIEELEKRFFYSASTLNRLFRASIGSTVWEFVLIKRLSLARGMIRAGRPAALAAAACGFGDYSAFYRKYLQIFGESPRKTKISANITDFS